MNNIPLLSDFRISEPLLHGVVGHYCEEEISKGNSSGEVIRLRKSEGGQQQRDCLDAAAEAIVLSQIIATVSDDSVFEELLSQLRMPEEFDLVEMRRNIFEQALSVAMDSLEGTDAQARVNERLARVRSLLVEV